MAVCPSARALVCLVVLAPALARAADQSDVVLPNEPGAARETRESLQARVAELEASVASLKASLEAESPDGLACQACAPAEDAFWTHRIVYDDGWFLRPLDPDQMPYELGIQWHDQYRYTGFARDDATSRGIDGTVRNIERRNDFDVNRGRLLFRGYAISPKLKFYSNIDYNTVSSRSIQLHSIYMRYDVADSLRVGYGLVKLPGTWEWLESSRYTVGAERSLATTYFRPSFTTGVWAEGDLANGVSYYLMLGDGFNTASLLPEELDTNFVYSGMVWWEPLGDFGVGFSDLEQHETPVVRVGQAFTFSRNDGGTDSEPTAEQADIRLSDGTQLIAPGALAPGVTVDEFELYLYSIHAGWKYRGLSISGEGFFRWLESLGGNGTLPRRSIQDQGFLAQAGAFVVPEHVELFSRTSYVTGPFGSGGEAAGGLNWYVVGTRNWRVTLDVGYVGDSPTEQSRTGYQVGGTGWLTSLQVWTIF